MGCGKVRIFQPEIRRWTCFYFPFLSRSFITNTFCVNCGDHCVCVPLIEGATRSGIAWGRGGGQEWFCSHWASESKRRQNECLKKCLIIEPNKIKFNKQM